MLKFWLVTCPDDFAAEYDDLEEMFKRGLTRLILDKHRGGDNYERWLLGLSMEYRERIWVRGTPDLANRLDVRGCVTEARSLMGEVPESWKRVNTIALCKSVEEMENLPKWVAGALFGPVFQPFSAVESIKTQKIDDLRKNFDLPVIPWGGIDPDSLGDLKDLPISGVACLGGVWNYADPISAFVQLQRAVNGVNP